MAGIFKAYDIRGTYPDQIDAALGARIARATVEVLSARRLVVARDMRESGETLRDAMLQAIAETGCEVIDIGRVSTPMCYWAVNTFGADGGIMITASHNPARYNGCKISGPGARPVSYDTGIAEIERRAMSPVTPAPSAASPGRIEQRNIVADYQRWLLNLVGISQGQVAIRPFTLAIDTGNGMMGELLPALLSALPCRVVPLFFEPDGRFPNHEPNPLNPDNMRDLQAAVRRERADLGIAFDGDGDRVMFVDERGELVASDRITALLAGEFLARAPKSTIIYDLRSSWVVRDEILRAGGTPLESRVGHSFIKQSMRKTDAVFAGELSGHFYFRDAFFTDNAELAMLHVLALLSQRGQPLSQILAPYDRYFATGELNFSVADKDACIGQLKATFADAEFAYLDGVTLRYTDWWCNVRPSNTEPVLRLNLEAKTPALRDQMLARVEALLGPRVQGH
jgi:phosphomannomutase